MLFQSKTKWHILVCALTLHNTHPHFRYKKQNKYYPYVHWINLPVKQICQHSLSFLPSLSPPLYTLQAHKDVYRMVLALTWALHLTHKIPSQPPTPFPWRSSTLSMRRLSKMSTYLVSRWKTLKLCSQKMLISLESKLNSFCVLPLISVKSRQSCFPLQVTSQTVAIPHMMSAL